MNKLKTVGYAIANKFSRQMLTVRRNSPVLMLGGGVALVVTGGVMACRATLKLGDVLEDAEKKLRDVDSASSNVEEEEFKKVNFGTRLNTAVKIAKLYAPAVLVGAVGIGALTGSHVVLKKRNASLAAAYTIVDKSFKEYRARVVDDQGKEKDLEYRFGTTTREVVDETDTGPVVSTIKEIDEEKVKENADSTYARVFDDKCPDWSPVRLSNRHFITGHQNVFNDQLRLKGYVFLNEVYKALGFPETKAGQHVGWVRNPKNGDGYVDFGIVDAGLDGELFMSDKSPNILLDFNVDGEIGNLIEDIQRENRR